MMSEPSAFWSDLTRDLEDPDAAAEFAANQAEVQAYDREVNDQCVMVGIDPGHDSAIVVAERRDGTVYIEPKLDREALNAWILAFAERVRPVIDAMRAQFEALCTALRPVAEYLAELHELYPDPEDWEIEPEPESCHHLCGRDPEHDCLGEASATIAFLGGDGREVPICSTCRAYVVDSYVRAGVVSRAEYLELMGVSIEPDPGGGYDGIIGSLEGGAYPPTGQPVEPPDDIGGIMATRDWGRPLTAADANWPADASKVCAHVCGPDPDHRCQAGATARLEYTLPSGGTRSMPICRSCFNSEWAAKQRYMLTSEGELVRLDCKECPETLLRVSHPTEEAHDAVREACAEHDRLEHSDDQ